MKRIEMGEVSEWPGVVFLCLVAFIAGVFLLYGCASTPSLSPAERVVRDAEKCQEIGPCVLVQVTNDNWLDASVWINSKRMGMVNGMGSLTLFIPVSQLSEGGRCIVGSFRPVGPHLFFTSNKECLQARGGHFTLQFDSLSHVWLVPWVNA